MEIKRNLVFLAFLLAFVSYIGAAALSYASEPSLARMTCQEYWDHHKKMAENQKEFFAEHNDLWNYSLDKFKKDNPALTNSSDVFEELNGSDGAPFFIMMIYMACEMRPENMKQNMGDRLQKTLYKASIIRRQENIAKQNHCSFESYSNDEKISRRDEESVIYLCVNRNWSKSFGKTNDLGKKVRCFDYRGNEEKCYELYSDKENTCLGQFGSCSQSSKGECGWVHTEESKSCLNK